MRAMIFAGSMVAAWSATAVAQAPSPGSGGGGPVGPSITQPTAPTGATPPGTPSGQTMPERQARDAIGTAVIGKTETPGGAVPGNTGGADSGVRR